MSKKRIILSAGGTGGHLFPAQSLARSIQGDADLLFVGGKLKSSPYFNQNEFPFDEITTSSLSSNHPFLDIFKIMQGFFESLKILHRFQPHLVIGFGSFYTFPLLLAATLKGIPLLLHEQNSLPGKVNRLFSRFARCTAITFPETKSHLKGCCQLVDFPLRMRKDPSLKEEAIHYFGLEKEKKTLLIFGGSQGAKVINEMMIQVLPSLSSQIQVIHLTGENRSGENLSDIYQKEKVFGCVKSYESRMELALAAADLVISRSGASTISELIEWELPAILIPFPYAADNHQEYNAKHFTEVAQGGALLLESTLREEQMREMISLLLGKEGEEKKKNLQSYKKKKEVLDFSELVRAHL